MDHHVARLAVTQDFWEDRSEEVVGPARDAIDHDHDRLAAALTARWGPAEEVDLGETDRELGEAADFFRSQTRDMLVWSCPTYSRWVALAVIQADPELPFELFVAVGAGPTWSAARN
ncbi:hypothetical protein [Actinoplanes sp. NBRC 101535]|uniref:hypothetical protein n=1 Tax=Actinoplanes sp. NBRC 101535 TaxID=3032196 RepID=UPI0024A355B2|nr:hypothetical protein [Actinoplanes sp. NBRC 101535]GLY07795.1 hypothetical protein Acsp01_81740 [Actinoplanes sp. NBRC 101535]